MKSVIKFMIYFYEVIKTMNKKTIEDIVVKGKKYARSEPDNT